MSVFVSLKSELAYIRYKSLYHFFLNWLDRHPIAQCLCQYIIGVFTSWHLLQYTSFRYDAIQIRFGNSLMQIQKNVRKTVFTSFHFNSPIQPPPFHHRVNLMLHPVFCTFNDGTFELDSVVVLSRSLGLFSQIWPAFLFPQNFLNLILFLDYLIHSRISSEIYLICIHIICPTS